MSLQDTAAKPNIFQGDINTVILKPVLYAPVCLWLLCPPFYVSNKYLAP